MTSQASHICPLPPQHSERGFCTPFILGVSLWHKCHTLSTYNIDIFCLFNSLIEILIQYVVKHIQLKILFNKIKNKKYWKLCAWVKACKTSGIARWVREHFKYYFADFVRKWGTPPPLRKKNSAKKEVLIWGYPPPLRNFPREFFFKKG